MQWRIQGEYSPCLLISTPQKNRKRFFIILILIKKKRKNCSSNLKCLEEYDYFFDFYSNGYNKDNKDLRNYLNNNCSTSFNNEHHRSMTEKLTETCHFKYLRISIKINNY